MFFQKTGDQKYPYAFSDMSAINYYKQGTFTQQEKEDFFEASCNRSDMAAIYMCLFKDEITVDQREKLFNSLLTGRDHALAFMKKKIYTEEERIKFQQSIAKMPKVFFKYLKKFPDMLREEEKDNFYQKNKARLIKDTFRNDFDGFEKVFRNQLTSEKEMNFVIDQVLKLKKVNNDEFLKQFLDYIENKNLTIPQETKDKLLGTMILGKLI